MFNPNIVIVPNPKDSRINFARLPGEEGFSPPSFIQKSFFNACNMDITYYKAEAKNEKAILMGSSGLKADYPLTPESIKTLNDAGISVLWIVLPNSGRSRDAVPFFKLAAYKLLSSPPQDIQNWLERDVPKVYFAHSAGAQIFYHMLNFNPAFKKLSKTFVGATLTSPFIRPANASSGVGKYALKAVSIMRGDMVPPEAFEARMFMGKGEFNLENHKYQKYLMPTFTQIQELGRSGEEVWNFAKDSKSNLHKTPFPIAMFVGKKDDASCPHTNEALAEQLGHAFHLSANSGHGTVNEDRVALDLFKDSILHMAKGTFEKFAEENGLYQRRTRFLNSVASRAQSLLRGSIGNAEMRR